MTIEEFAKSLNNRQYRKEITTEEEEIAKKNGWVVIFGYSDDNVELRGSIFNELGAWNGTKLYFINEDLLEPCECECKYYLKALKSSKIVNVDWEKDGYSWVIDSKIPHFSFDILEEEEKYCKGAVFKRGDL